jgi:hypothetical protein
MRQVLIFNYFSSYATTLVINFGRIKMLMTGRIGFLGAAIRPVLHALATIPQLKDILGI